MISLDVRCLGVAVLYCSCLLACNSAEPHKDAKQDASTHTSDAGGDGRLPSQDIGASCGGGCAGADICTVRDNSCVSGHCLFDARTETPDAYCTANCSSIPCPSGFSCEDIPFELTRACVRGESSSGLGYATGSVRLKGAIAVSDEDPVPFEYLTTIDTELSSNLSGSCGAVTVRFPEAGAEKGVQLYIRPCNPSVANDTPAILLVEVPFREGSFTSNDADAVYPSIHATVGSVTENTLARYGDSRDAAGAVLQVTDVVGVEVATTPWRCERLHFEINGTLLDDESCTGPACGAASPTLDLSLSLELTSIVLGS